MSCFCFGCQRKCRAVLLAALLSFAACGQSPGMIPDDDAAPASDAASTEESVLIASKLIEATAGGTLTVEGSGTALDQLQVIVPPNALGEDTEIQVFSVQGHALQPESRVHPDHPTAS